MRFHKTDISKLVIVEPTVFSDPRGYFLESYNKAIFEDSGSSYSWVQDDESFSYRGTIRGLHYQTGKWAQAKLVRVIKGEVLDVVLDLRANSTTFGKTFSVMLSEENRKQLLIPRGFAHGFSVLSDCATMLYKVDNFYNKDSERGVLYSDQYLSIDWGIPENEIIVSPKDLIQPIFSEVREEYV